MAHSFATASDTTTIDANDDATIIDAANDDAASHDAADNVAYERQSAWISATSIYHYY